MRIKSDSSFISKHPIVIYFVITFIITMMLGAAYQFTNNAFISPQYAPTIGLIVICAMLKDWSVWQTMIGQTFNRQINYSWFFIALLLPIAVLLISSLIMSLFGSPFVLWQITTTNFFVIMITIILGCIFEEIGWRGYLLPKFSEKHTMFHSSIGVGLLWGIWHLKFAYGLFGFILFVLLIICFSILMTWIYLKTKGNLFSMILFHFGVNIGTVTLLQNKEGVLFYSIATIICVLICIPVVLMNKNEFFNREFLKVMDPVQNKLTSIGSRIDTL